VLYTERLPKAAALIKPGKAIGMEEYKEILNTLPLDMSARLRLVPDEGLPSRLAHMVEVARLITERPAVGGITDYIIISAEGSNNLIGFDCDLVIEDSQSSRRVYIDVTSSTDPDVVKKKQGVLDGNIRSREIVNSEGVVWVFRPVVPVCNIQISFQSSEPGTKGLVLMDMLSTHGAGHRKVFIDKCKQVYGNVVRELAQSDVGEAPGDYKEYNLPHGLVDDSVREVSRQSVQCSINLLKNLEAADSSHFPYHSGLKTLIQNSNKIKAAVNLAPSELLSTKDLVANLESLSDDWLCHALYSAMLTDNVVVVDDTHDTAIVEDFPARENKVHLPTQGKYLAAIKYEGKHVFTVYVKRGALGSKFDRASNREQNRDNKKWFTGAGAITDEMVDTYYKEVEESEVAFNNSMIAPLLEASRETIWNKMLTISALASNDLENMGRSTLSMFDSLVTALSSCQLGGALSHDYEVCKTVVASLKTSPSNSQYYVGVNGPYRSVTMVKMCSTLDSFSTTSYCVIYKPVSAHNNLLHKFKVASGTSVVRTEFYTHNPNTLSYGLRLPYIVASHASWEIENNLESGAIQGKDLTMIMLDSAKQALVNKDTFAQAAEQTRYFYMSAIGYGGSAAAMIDKANFIPSSRFWEPLFVLRMFKMGAALTVISSASKLQTLEDPNTGELAVCFPHSNMVSKSFSGSVSSMYICNIYNKFRAFHEVSEAICYNSILEEREIYKSRVRDDVESVSGLRKDMMMAVSKGWPSTLDEIMSQSFVQKEVEFALRIARVKQERYCGSCTFMVGASATHVGVGSSMIDTMYMKLNEAPVDLINMRGGMASGEPSTDHQGIRSATSLLEEIVSSHDATSQSVSSSPFSAMMFFETIKDRMQSFSIFSCVMAQLVCGYVMYAYRIIQKDQKGHREISAMNFAFRVGALFVETIADCLSTAIDDTDVIGRSDKDKYIEDVLVEGFDLKKKAGGTCFFDNSDQKRWGPNHNMNFFAYVLFPMLVRDMGLFRMCLKVFDSTFSKRAKFPESLIDLVVKKGVTASKSKPIDQFVKRCKPLIDNNVTYTIMAAGMCQGVFGRLSSLVHSVNVLTRVHIMKLYEPRVSVRFLVTSDDALGRTMVPSDVNRLDTVRLQHVTGLKVGSLTNIVRGGAKSSFSFVIGELNSIFVKRGRMATPSLKQRIAKLDVGQGLDPVQDYMSALGGAANYLSSGGSYMGSYIVSVLNLTMHTEQWLRWGLANSDHYYKPVELGGFPVVEPISCVLSGGLSNLFMRSRRILNERAYAKLVTATLLCEPVEVTLSDFLRNTSEGERVAIKLNDVVLHKSSGPLGVVQLVRTDKKLSQFERRHKVSKWPIPPEFVGLERRSNYAGDLIHTIFRTTSVSTAGVEDSVNSFFIRFAEPWVAMNRKCYKVVESSPLAGIYRGEAGLISHADILEIYRNQTPIDAARSLNTAYLGCKTIEEFEVFECQLSVRLEDATSIVEYLTMQEAEEFTTPKNRPSFQTVQLRGQTAPDELIYQMLLIKSLSGRAARDVINECMKDPSGYEMIGGTEPDTALPLAKSIILSDNAIAVYGKFVRRSTKMTLSNRAVGLTDLVVGLIRSKFTERMGLITGGNLTLAAERSRPFAHSRWYTELIKSSQSYETVAAGELLHGKQAPPAAVGVESNKMAVQKHEPFIVVRGQLPAKTVVIDAVNKEQFIGQVKTWLAARPRFMFTRRTVKSFLEGRLSFAHDYYTGGSSYSRHAKSKYLLSTAGGQHVAHIIETTASSRRGESSTVYNHHFIADDDVTPDKLSFKISPEYKDAKWLSALVAAIASLRRIDIGKEYAIRVPRSGPRQRRTVDEVDTFTFHTLRPGDEMDLVFSPDSLTISLKLSNLIVPITYVTAGVVHDMPTRYTLEHNDMNTAAQAFHRLSDMTNSYSKTFLANHSAVRDFMDFVLVRSSIQTPVGIIERETRKVGMIKLTPEQVDILRAMLVKHSGIGLGYSSGRLSTYLLNNFNRREHFHSHFTKTAEGIRDDNDSLDWDVDVDDAELFQFGQIDPPTEHDAYSSVCSVDYQDEEELVNDCAFEVAEPGHMADWFEKKFDSWADEMDDFVEEQGHPSTAAGPAPANNENWETKSTLSFSFASDSDIGGDLDEELPTFAPGKIRECTTQTQGLAGASLNALMSTQFDGMLGGLSLEDVFDIDSEGGEPEQPAAGPSLVLDTMQDVFAKFLSKTYGKVVDAKDEKLRTVINSHTAAGVNESAASILNYLRCWLRTAGRIADTVNNGRTTSDLTGLMRLYIEMQRFVPNADIDIMGSTLGTSTVEMPAEFSVLTVISMT